MEQVNCNIPSPCECQIGINCPFCKGTAYVTVLIQSTLSPKATWFKQEICECIKQSIIKVKLTKKEENTFLSFWESIYPKEYQSLSEPKIEPHYWQSDDDLYG